MAFQLPRIPSRGVLGNVAGNGEIYQDAVNFGSSSKPFRMERRPCLFEAKEYYYYYLTFHEICTDIEPVNIKTTVQSIRHKYI